MLGVIVLGLLVANITGVVLESVLAYESRFTRLIVQYFDFNKEENFPAFFSAVILLFAGLLLFLIHKRSRSMGAARHSRHWFILGCIFVFMAVDESVQLHEHIAEFVRPKLSNDLNGLLHWSWVVPYAVFVLIVVAYFLNWVLRLPAETRNIFFISGFMFVAGALGLELVEGYLFKAYGIDHLYNRVMYCIEELLEMSAVVLFIYALLRHMERSSTRLVFRSQETTEVAESKLRPVEASEV
ncbi:hypothetical protein GCM10028895_38130 [Pontibacter rugosus]